MLPADNGPEAALVEGVCAYPIHTLPQAVEFLKGGQVVAPSLSNYGMLESSRPVEDEDKIRLRRMSEESITLLQTKLHRPPITKGLIVRSRLLEQLDSDIDRPLTLVCAPAGFGKTTLVCTWFERMAAGQSAAEASLPTAWLTLDENDSDFNLFLRSFIAALRTIFTGACEETLKLLHSQQHPPLEVLHTTFSNDLEQLSESFILALDDYHTIQTLEVHAIMARLLQHMPGHVHLVLTTRADPPLPLERNERDGEGEGAS